MEPWLFLAKCPYFNHISNSYSFQAFVVRFFQKFQNFHLCNFLKTLEINRDPNNLLAETDIGTLAPVRSESLESFISPGFHACCVFRLWALFQRLYGHILKFLGYGQLALCFLLLMVAICHHSIVLWYSLLS